MVGETHQERLKYTKNFFSGEFIADKSNFVFSDFKEIRINNLKSKLIELSGKSTGTKLALIFFNLYIVKKLTD